MTVDTVTLKKASKGIGWFISNVHPLIYLSIYIFLLLPGFAIAYYFWSDEFFAPYARFEPAAQNDREKLDAIIADAIHNSLQQLRYRSAGPIIVQGWRLDDPGSIGVSAADSDNGSTISFKVHALLEKETPKGPTALYVELHVAFPGARGRVVRAPGYNRSYPNNVRSTQASFEVGPDDRVAVEKDLYHTIFRSYGETVILDDTIVFSELASKEVDNFLSGVKGNANSVSGSLGRMFYFSAIVITTVGFGDILPLTPLARALVAAEALLGIIMAGFFLNAIAHRAAGNR
jgi:hypothetical protein